MLSPTLRTLALECASEFIGTFVLVFLGTAGIAAAAFTTPGSVDLALEQVAIGWGVAATLATIVGSPGSGAHLNPAVTLAIAISPHTRSGFQTCKIPAYMLFQLLGATIAGLAVYLVFGSAIARYEARLGLSRGTGSSSLSAVAFGASFLHPQLVYASGEEGSSFWSKSDVSVVGAVFLEALGTMLFVLVQRVIRQPQQETGVAAFTNSTAGAQDINEMPPSRMPATPLAPLYVGTTLAALTMVMTPFTQACLNPARDFGPRVVAAIAGWAPSRCLASAQTRAGCISSGPWSAPRSAACSSTSRSTQACRPETRPRPPGCGTSRWRARPSWSSSRRARRC
ncbi:hypothetical protein PF003_g16879 [Phytophthora fragariae]|nr:hypothetical protein PF003_g16879 [Phytophthora fragariae]